MLDLSPVLILSSAIIFLLVVARLNSCLFKPLLKHMDDRAESIKNDLANAKSNSTNVDSIYKEANDILADAKKEASIIREQAYAKSKKIADAKLEDSRKNLAMKSFEFKNDLEKEVKALKKSLLSSMPQFNERLKAKISSI